MSRRKFGIRECWVNVYETVPDGKPFFGTVLCETRTEADECAVFVQSSGTARLIYRLRVRSKPGKPPLA